MVKQPKIYPNEPLRAAKTRLPKFFVSWSEGLVLFFYLALAIAFTWPMVLHFGEGVPGQNGGHDNWQMVWNLWWVRYAVEHGQNPFHTNLMFWPGGTNLYLHALNAFNGFLSLPVQYVADWAGTGARGAMAGYNFIVLWSLVVGALGARWLAAWLWGKGWGALLAGLAYGFSTYQFDHLLGHLNLVSSEFIPFYILFWLKTLTAPTSWLKPALLAVLFLILNTFLELQYVLYLAIFSWLCLIYITAVRFWEVWGKRAKAGSSWLVFVKQSWLRAAFIAATFLLVTLPFSLNALHDALTNPNTIPVRQDEIYSADLLAYFVPSPFQPLWATSVQTIIRPFTAPLIEKVVFPGYVIWLLILAGVGVSVGQLFRKLGKPKAEPVGLTKKPERFDPIFWLLIALAFILLSFGRKLHINGIEYGPTLPAALIYKLPILNITRVPARFAVIGLLALAMLAAWGLQRFLGQLKNIRLRHSLAVATIIILGFELWPAPYPFSTYSLPEFYSTLATDLATDYAVLDIPLNTGSFQYDTSYLEAQMTHHKPLLGGYISRNPQYPPFMGVPVFNEWRTFVAEPKPDILPTTVPNLDILRYFGVRYVAIHKDSLSDKQRDAALGLATKLFPGGPLSDKDNLVVYEVEPLAVQNPVEFYYPNAPDWYAAEQTGQGQVSRWAQSNSAKLEFWVTTAKTIQLELPIWSFQQAHTVEFELNGRPLVQNEISTTPQTVPLTLNLQAGENTLTLKINGGALVPQKLGLSPDPRALTVAVGQIKIVAK